MPVDLHTRIVHAINARDTSIVPYHEVNAALRAVVELCTEQQAEAVGGGFTDVDTIRPSDILAAIARDLSVEVTL